MIAARARASSRRPLRAAVDLGPAAAIVATAIEARALHGAAGSGGP